MGTSPVEGSLTPTHWHSDMSDTSSLFGSVLSLELAPCGELRYMKQVCRETHAQHAWLPFTGVSHQSDTLLRKLFLPQHRMKDAHTPQLLRLPVCVSGPQKSPRTKLGLSW